MTSKINDIGYYYTVDDVIFYCVVLQFVVTKMLVK